MLLYTRVELEDAFLDIDKDGISCFERPMSLRWRVKGAFLDAHFLGMHDDVVWLESAAEGTWGYRIADGARVTGSPGERTSNEVSPEQPHLQ